MSKQACNRELDVIRQHLEAARVWMISRPNVRVSDELERILLEAKAEIATLTAEIDASRIGDDIVHRAEEVHNRVIALQLRDRLEWELEWVKVYRDLSPAGLEAELSALLIDAASEIPSNDLPLRAKGALGRASAVHSRIRWESLIARVRGHKPALPPNEDIVGGWEHLRDAFGERIWSSPLADFVCNLIVEDVVAHGRLGILLRESANRPGYTKLIERFLEDDAAVQGLLAEFGALWTLRERGATAEMLLILGKETGDRTCADIRMSQPFSFDVEVSYLGDASTWTLALDLRSRLERGIREALAAERPTVVRVCCTGYAGDLIRHVPAACDALRKRIGVHRPWTEQLVAGFMFEVSDATLVTEIDIVGATVHSGDPSANENPLRRLPPKVEKEAKQVPEGGVVLICTSQLSIHAAQAPSSNMAAFASMLYETLADACRDAGARMTNVSAFAILDTIRGSAQVGVTPDLGGVASLAEVATQLGSQRLLWVPNPAATRPIDPLAERLFRPPFGLYS